VVVLLAAWSATPAVGQTPPPWAVAGARAPDGRFTLAWPALGEGMAYSVQSRDSLVDGLWLMAPGAEPWPLAGAAWTDPRPATEAGRFYRVLAVNAAQRGKVLARTAAAYYAKSLLTFLLASQGITETPQYDVALYTLRYETIDPLGSRTQASGVLALPVNPGRTIPLLSYQHGTLVRKADAPSLNALGERLIAVAFAAAGYAGVVPDYLGMGDSPGTHPYHHARSEATACVDMLRAARTACAEAGVSLNDQLFLCGYSQGGHATMALHRELETYHASEFTVTASAPMAGAYDLSGVTTDDVLSGRPMPNPYYFIYVLASYQAVYHLANSLADLLAPPYDTALPPLMNGLNGGDTINAAMPLVATNILRPSQLEAFLHDPQHPLRVALRDNDLYAWAPRAPIRLYHCSGDLDVPPANSQVAYDSLRRQAQGPILLINPSPGANHGGCVLPSMLGAKAWFDGLKR
jgi:hypothetical protein